MAVFWVVATIQKTAIFKDDKWLTGTEMFEIWIFTHATKKMGTKFILIHTFYCRKLPRVTDCENTR
jgi:hypothetical protein